jgi:hypothetical protein
LPPRAFALLVFALLFIPKVDPHHTARAPLREPTNLLIPHPASPLDPLFFC